MKVFVCALYFIAVTCSYVTAQSNTVSWGERQSGDSQIYYDFIIKKSSFLQVCSQNNNVMSIFLFVESIITRKLNF